MDTSAPVPPALPPEPRASRIQQSVGFKVVVIAALVLLLLIPLSLLEGLIRERQQMRENVQQEVASQWGLAQVIGGPVLSVPYTVLYTREDGKTARQRGFVHFLPDELNIEATLTPEVRRRDIYEVILYRSDIRLDGRFGALNADAPGVPTEAVLDWEHPVLTIGISDLSGLKSLVALQWGSQEVQAEPGLPTNDLFGSGLSFPITLQADSAGQAFRLALDLNGSSSMAFLPFGKQTRAHVRAPWGTPSFSGTFLPDERTVTDTAFDARWSVLYLNRNYPQTFAGPISRSDARALEIDYDRQPASVEESGLGAFGVRLLLPLDEYQKTMRSAEYGLLCVLLTFVTIFFVEILGRRRTHPLQYLLVGFAVSLFYLLLLSFAEYVRFNLAYLLAAGAVLTLILLYTRAIFRSWRYAGIVTGLLFVFYGYFFVLLQLEAYALLFGSLGLLLILGTVMYISRNVDWYAVGTRARGDEARE